MILYDGVVWSAELFGTCVCLYIYLYVVIFFLAIGSNEECTEEGEVYEYQDEEDQGQASQGKPSNLMHI
jgi:hypothetical protein